MKHAVLPDPAGFEPVLATPAAQGAEAPRRPRLLWRAARAGARLYRRETHLRAAAPGFDAGRGPKAVIAKLEELEQACEARRRAHAPEYSVRRHVLLLSALLAERAAPA
ncbi:DUF6477 family protein [Albimonas sp. CAU 1670]|uniref:DUF6477 family protein n=1 Tax=Albimonas sp. CAU 1670 TaxID=3032599 RepID=UPI0023DBCF3F|nr:DUF6477 family protein [Albimonas sp. CAU 1670]MDF2231569.1 DUF6477 family protein [Albimonas sp. CAU 1670]